MILVLYFSGSFDLACSNMGPSTGNFSVNEVWMRITLHEITLSILHGILQIALIWAILILFDYYFLNTQCS